jgi:hypothetical protein
MADFNVNDVLSEAGDIGGALWDVISPFVPALKREGQDIYEGFIKALLTKDFTAIDQLLYAKMTPEERAKLDAQVLSGALDAARARYRRTKLEKDILFKVAVRLLVLFAVG